MPNKFQSKEKYLQTGGGSCYDYGEFENLARESLKLVLGVEVYDLL